MASNCSELAVSGALAHSAGLAPLRIRRSGADVPHEQRNCKCNGFAQPPRFCSCLWAVSLRMQSFGSLLRARKSQVNHRRAWRGGRWLVRGGGWLVRVGVSGRLMGIYCPGEFWSREDTNTSLFGRPLEGVQDAPCRSEKMRLAEAPRPFSGWSQIRKATMS